MCVTLTLKQGDLPFVGKKAYLTQQQLFSPPPCLKFMACTQRPHFIFSCTLKLRGHVPPQIFEPSGFLMQLPKDKKEPNHIFIFDTITLA